MHHFETVLALLVGVAFLALLARRLAVPTPALFVAGGLLVALLPGLPAVQFDPQLVFLVFIPPLLYRASLLASYRDVRANLRPILLLGVGLAVAWLLGLVRRRIHDPEVENTISLLTGYAAYLPAEHLGVSGILAVVATGLYLGRVGPRFVAADTRVQNTGVWAVVVFIMEGLIFILTGLALRPILGSLSEASAFELARGAGLVSLAVIARLGQRHVAQWMHPETLALMRDRYGHRPRRFRGQSDGVADGGEETISAADRRLVQELLTVERRELLRLRDEGAISDAVMRRVQRDLDLEELLLEPE